MNSIELIVSKKLNLIGFYTKNYSIKCCSDPLNTFYFQYPINTFKLDFALPQIALAIEVMGDYWHGSDYSNLSAMQVKNKLNDLVKQQYLTQQGWHLIHLWEKDIRNIDLSKYINSLILKRFEQLIF